MPRRPPSALRTENVRHQRRLKTDAPVPGMSPAALAELAHVEVTELSGKSVASALDLCTRFLKQPGRVLYLPMYEDYCLCHNVVYAREFLDRALAALPRWVARQIRPAVLRFDTEYLARTLPNPALAGPWLHWSNQRCEDWSGQEWWAPRRRPVPPPSSRP